jgi:formylglycine-generating enzyme required for sulfatase activity
MTYVAISFLLRLPFFDIMPPLGPSIALWVSYLTLLPIWICLTFIWAARTRERISAAEAAETALPPAELALAQKRFRRKVRIYVLLILLAIAVVFIIRRSTLFITAPDIKLAYIPAGEFMMGSASNEDALPNLFQAKPQHKVRISKGFYIGVTEVTQAQWKAIMRNNPSKFTGDDLPVENISWYEAVRFCKKLSRATGKRYRLPTEAEWEYACRAGTQTRFYFGDDPNLLGEYAWWAADSQERTHPVGQKKPNAFGLYDMLGNVAEWCSDVWDGEYYKRSPSVDPENTTGAILFRVLRGCSWWGMWSPFDYSCAQRGGKYPHLRSEQTGFRVVMETE